MTKESRAIKAHAHKTPAFYGQGAPIAGQESETFGRAGLLLQS